MSLYSLLQSLGVDCGDFVGIAVVLLGIVEIAPVKIHPLEWIGKRLNADVLSRVSSIETKVDELQTSVSEEKMMSARCRIIAFDDERQRGQSHTEAMCEQIMKDCDIYETYCKAHKEFSNNVGRPAFERIQEAYNKNELNKGAKVDEG